MRLLYFFILGGKPPRPPFTGGCTPRPPLVASFFNRRTSVHLRCVKTTYVVFVPQTTYVPFTHRRWTTYVRTGRSTPTGSPTLYHVRTNGYAVSAPFTPTRGLWPLVYPFGGLRPPRGPTFGPKVLWTFGPFGTFGADDPRGHLR